MFSAEMPDLPPYVTRSSGLWKQTDGSDSKNSGDTGWESINWNIWKGKRGTARFQLPPPPPFASPPSSSYQRIHWENWMWFVCVFLKRGAHKQPWKGPLYSARQQRCASLGRPFVFPPVHKTLSGEKKRRLILSRCEQAQMMPLDLGARFGWEKKKKKKASVAFEVI